MRNYQIFRCEGLNLLVILFLTSKVFAECDPQRGPGGETVCLLDSPQYEGLQCATCLPHEYIVQRSFGEHGCNDSDSFCYYPCMLDKFGLDKGRVESECSCLAEGLMNPTPHLPVECRSPALTNCSWYNQCLSPVYPCSSRSDETLGYGEVFCRLASQPPSLAAAAGISQCTAEWISGVSQCILAQTSSLIRKCSSDNSVSPSEACKVYESSALEAQSRCYTESWGSFSICNLNCSGFVEVFNVVISALNLERGQNSNAVKTMLLSAKNCSNLFQTSECTPSKFLEVGIKISSNSQFFQIISGNDTIAIHFIDKLAEHFNWFSNPNLKWLAYASRLLSPVPKELIAQLFLTSTNPNELTDAVGKFKDWVTLGNTLYVDTLDTSINVQTLKACQPHDGLENCNQLLASSTQTLSSRVVPAFSDRSTPTPPVTPSSSHKSSSPTSTITTVAGPIGGGDNPSTTTFKTSGNGRNTIEHTTPGRGSSSSSPSSLSSSSTTTSSSARPSTVTTHTLTSRGSSSMSALSSSTTVSTTIIERITVRRTTPGRHSVASSTTTTNNNNSPTSRSSSSSTATGNESTSSSTTTAIRLESSRQTNHRFTPPPRTLPLGTS